MSPSRSDKPPWRQFLESHAWLKPLGAAIDFLLATRFKFINASLRNWLWLRLAAIRLLRGRKLVVVYRDVGIGDIVCTFPLIVELKKLFTREIIVYVTHRQFRYFVEKFSGGDAVLGTSYVLYSQPLPRLPAWIAAKALHPLYGDEDPALPKKERIGYTLEMARSCGISLSESYPRLAVDEAEASSLLPRYVPGQSQRPYIGIHAGPTQPVREWPLESWRELIRLLHQELGATVFQFGSRWHLSHPGEMKERLPVQCDLTDRLDLIETTLLISKMDLFIGIDSGLLHIAHAAGIRCLGLFGPTNPAVVLGGQSTAGLSSQDLPCIFCQHRRLNLHWGTGCPYDIRCMGMLSTDMVFAQVKTILQPTSSTRDIAK